MRKAIAVLMVCLLVCATVALADNSDRQTVDPQTIRGPMGSPNFGNRDGSCIVGLMIPDSIHYYWTWIPGEGFANYVDPAVDQPLGGGCTPPIYPFHVTSVDVFLGLYGTAAMVGHTIVVEVDIQCPANIGQNYPDRCEGPGSILCSQQLSHVVTQAEYDSPNYLDLTVPMDCCVNGPFYYTVKLISWDGANTPTTEVPVFFSKGSPIPAQECKVWYLTARTISWGGQNVLVAPCWLEVVTGFNPPVWGPWASWASGTSNATCTPIACAPCTPVYPGDDASHPIMVNTSPWSQTINLCQYCRNYDFRVEYPPSANFTASGEDVVLELAFNPNLPQVCFTLTIAPACPVPTFFRIRSWLSDAYGVLYTGNPQFPTFNQTQVYNFTPSGVSCYQSDGFNVLKLYIDTRGCCCPVTVTYSGDAPLSVEFAAFDAVGMDGKVALTWQTRSESNVDHYVVTRNDNVTYEVRGMGDSPSGHAYNLVDGNVVNGTTYTYHIASVDVNGSVSRFERTASATPMADVVTEYALNQNYPNPFNPSTMISYAVKDAGQVTLKVYSVDGRLVSTLVNAKQESGKYTVNFDGSKLASGVYLYKLETSGFSATRKMVLMK